MKRSLELVGLGLFICLAPGGLARGQVTINVSPMLPTDIAGGAPAATLQQAAAFAWQEFIALNWPAMAGQRDVADQNQKFGRALAHWYGRRFAARSRFSILPKTTRGIMSLPATPRRRRIMGTTHRRLIFTKRAQCRLVPDKPNPPRQPGSTSTRRPRSGSLKSSRAVLPSRIAQTRRRSSFALP